MRLSPFNQWMMNQFSSDERLLGTSVNGLSFAVGAGPVGNAGLV
jgi:hypothetical protein